MDAAATTSTSPSARATCRRRRCSSRSPTARSPTTARSSARTSASASRTATASRSTSLATDPRRHIKLDPADRQTVLDGLERAANQDGRHLGRRLQGLAEALPRLRQDGHRRARAEPRPGLVRLLRQRSQAPDRRRRHGREGRLRRRDRRAGGAADPLKVVRRQGRRVPRRVQRHPLKDDVRALTSGRERHRCPRVVWPRRARGNRRTPARGRGYSLQWARLCASPGSRSAPPPRSPRRCSSGAARRCRAGSTPRERRVEIAAAGAVRRRRGRDGRRSRPPRTTSRPRSC